MQDNVLTIFVLKSIDFFFCIVGLINIYATPTITSTSDFNKTLDIAMSLLL